VSVVGWIRRERAPLVIALVAVLLELAAFLALSARPPSGERWFGDRMINAADQAVYLSYVEQIRDGANSLENLFAPAEGARFWLFVHVPIGWFARATGLSAILAHEVALWFATLAAVFLLHAVSRRLVEREADATLATALVVFAGGLGALASGPDVPDLTTETYFHPTLAMGAHIPLSFGLLAYALSTLAADGFTPPSGRRLAGPAALLALLLVHPYFAPLVAVFGAGLLLSGGRAILARCWPYALAGAVALAPHIATHLASPSRRFLLERNPLPLAGWSDWLLATAPWSVLALQRGRRRGPPAVRERWLVLWAASILVALCLPFEWKRKLTEGAGALLVWAAMPTLLALRGRRIVPGVPALVPVLMLASISPLLVHGGHVVAASDPSPEQRRVLYGPEDRFAAWDWLRRHTPGDAVVVVDDPWLAVWTPAYARRRVFCGHPHETPDYAGRRALQAEIFRTGAPARVQALLDAVPADWVLTRGSAPAERVARASWTRVATFGEMTVFSRPSGRPPG
jgi:hypothetical protein